MAVFVQDAHCTSVRNEYSGSLLFCLLATSSSQYPMSEHKNDGRDWLGKFKNRLVLFIDRRIYVQL